jgi:hypothetical protein
VESSVANFIFCIPVLVYTLQLIRDLGSNGCRTVLLRLSVDEPPCAVCFGIHFVTSSFESTQLGVYSLNYFLELGSAKGWQRFRETKIHNGGRVLLAFLNMYVRIIIRVATFDTKHSVTDCTQTINRCFNPETS